MREYPFYTLDVFTHRPFGGNPLALIPDARGLDALLMQKIAREFNFSETAFVFPPRGEGSWHLRIFTPCAEMPFAGHPTIGAALLLTDPSRSTPAHTTADIIFEEGAGLVHVTVAHPPAAPSTATLTAPQGLDLGRQVDPRALAPALAIDVAHIVTATHGPLSASMGYPFLMVELDTRETLAKVIPHRAQFAQMGADKLPTDIYCYTHGDEDHQVYARMFAPLDGIPEDPATGSAAVTLAALLTQLSPPPDLRLELTIRQGVEMGRPSTLRAAACKVAGRISQATVSGEAYIVSEGILRLP